MRIRPGLAGDLPFAFRSREAPDINLIGPGLIRCESEPAAIRRQAALDFIEGSRLNGNALPVAHHGDYVYIPLGCLALFINDQTAVRGPVSCVRIVLGVKQEFFFTK